MTVTEKTYQETKKELIRVWVDFVDGPPLRFVDALAVDTDTDDLIITKLDGSPEKYPLKTVDTYSSMWSKSFFPIFDQDGKLVEIGVAETHAGIVCNADAPEQINAQPRVAD